MVYTEFLSTKLTKFTPSGFEVPDDFFNPNLFPFQRDIVKLALKTGKFCIWANTGLGKGLMLLSWADAICRWTAEEVDVLILAPLGVAKQLEREAKKFEIATSVKYCRDQSEVESGITVTNYDRIHKFDAGSFYGVVLDESSAIKSSESATFAVIIDAFAATPYKLACSATPAPNDHMELGSQCEFLGVMSKVEMLAMFFTHDGGDTSKWVLKGHARSRFWEWVATWAVVLRKPSDLGYDDTGYDLPPLNFQELQITTPIESTNGELFATEARTLSEQRAFNKRTLADRITATATLVNASTEQWVIWCETNDESTRITKMVNGAIEVKGSDSPEFKEQAFLDFTDGKSRVLVSKASIAGFGLNWQHCHNCVFLCPSSFHSFERVYQAVRRFYRFGQTEHVNVWAVRHELDSAIHRNYQRKEAEAEQMYQGMMTAMRIITMAQLRGVQPDRMDYNPQVKMIAPEWLTSEVRHD